MARSLHEQIEELHDPTFENIAKRLSVRVDELSQLWRDFQWTVNYYEEFNDPIIWERLRISMES